MFWIKNKVFFLSDLETFVVMNKQLFVLLSTDGFFKQMFDQRRSLGWVMLLLYSEASHH